MNTNYSKKIRTKTIGFTTLLLIPLIVVGCLKKPKTEEGKADVGENKHSDHGHEHTSHLGVVVPFLSGQQQVGFAELKLHDDKGDLELWLTKDKAGTEPFDMSLGSSVSVVFTKMDQKIVQLKVRNSTKNEDEAGVGNIRSNATNYFIFPGETGGMPHSLLGKILHQKL